VRSERTQGAKSGSGDNAELPVHGCAQSIWQCSQWGEPSFDGCAQLFRCRLDRGELRRGGAFDCLRLLAAFCSRFS
jgi:hypothetical protein